MSRLDEDVQLYTVGASDIVGVDVGCGVHSVPSCRFISYSCLDSCTEVEPRRRWRDSY